MNEGGDPGRAGGTQRHRPLARSPVPASQEGEAPSLGGPHRGWRFHLCGGSRVWWGLQADRGAAVTLGLGTQLERKQELPARWVLVCNHLILKHWLTLEKNIMWTKPNTATSQPAHL